MNLMVEEMDALENNGAWHIVEFPSGKKYVGIKWLFKKKLNEKVKVVKYKSHLVEK
jgi:hypothetical protein